MAGELNCTYKKTPAEFIIRQALVDLSFLVVTDA